MRQIARGIELDPDYLGANGDAVTLAVALREFLASRGFNQAGSSVTCVHHVQTVASSEWPIPHTFGRPPNVVLQDADGVRFLAEIVDSASYDEVRVLLDSPCAGQAWLT